MCHVKCTLRNGQQLPRFDTNHYSGMCHSSCKHHWQSRQGTVHRHRRGKPMTKPDAQTWLSPSAIFHKNDTVVTSPLHGESRSVACDMQLTQRPAISHSRHYKRVVLPMLHILQASLANEKEPRSQDTPARSTQNSHATNR